MSAILLVAIRIEKNKRGTGGEAGGQPEKSGAIGSE